MPQKQGMRASESIEYQLGLDNLAAPKVHEQIKVNKIQPNLGSAWLCSFYGIFCCRFVCGFQCILDLQDNWAMI